ncbi:DeoR/GlpR family DNA-binding transcription regulator [Shouchella sp. 1P09AA]|uniref:DeoR/GlpR family DNA-binding transcription regulator n=1 Tax=unclassified Shouchella TaxID=2893065 RepID=UPI0039A0B099
MKVGIAMLAIERKRHILEYVKQHQLASVSELAVVCNVHQATIRRDLNELEDEGLLQRTHGGVMGARDNISSEPSFSEREQKHREEKERIGKQAAAYVEDGDTILIDSGTTTFQMVPHLLQRKQLTVVTNDINIAAAFRHAHSIKTFVTGGVLFHDSYMLNGTYTDDMLAKLHVQKAFIGTPAIHPEFGIMHFDDYLVSAKKKMIDAVEQVMVLADHTKMDQLSMHEVAPLTSVQKVITGTDLDERVKHAFEEKGVSVDLV